VLFNTQVPGVAYMQYLLNWYEDVCWGMMRCG
jgi:hypothetical protein